MPKLRLGPVLDEKPVKLTIDVPASVHRDLLSYAEALGRETGQTIDPAKLVAPYLHLQESYRDRLLGAPKSGEFGDKSTA